MQHSRKAFTLIELLVVIAIIAILAAILFPVFAQAKTAAKKTAHLSNIKQAATAATLYSNDEDDKLPTSPCFVNVPNTAPHDCDEFSKHITWRYKVQPYMKQKDIFVPPGFDYPGSFNPGTVYWFGVNYVEEAKAGVKPGMAGSHTWTNPDYYGYQGLSTTETTRPASLLMFMPSRYEFADLGDWTLDYPWIGGYPGKGPMQAYNGRANFAMMDTHAISKNPCATYGALKWADGTTPDDDFLWEWFGKNPNYGWDVQSSVLRGWGQHCAQNPEYK